MLYVWIAVIILSIVFEVATAEMVSIWFLPGAVISLVLALCGVNPPVQIVVFVCVSALCVVFCRRLFGLNKQVEKTNIDAIIGEKALVIEKIDNNAGCGLAKVKGQLWSARSVSDEETFGPGEILRVIAIEGVKVICKKQ